MCDHDQRLYARRRAGVDHCSKCEQEKRIATMKARPQTKAEIASQYRWGRAQAAKNRRDGMRLNEDLKL